MSGAAARTGNFMIITRNKDKKILELNGWNENIHNRRDLKKNERCGAILIGYSDIECKMY